MAPTTARLCPRPGWPARLSRAQLVMRAPEMLARKHITLRTGVRVFAIDRAAAQWRFADGSTLAYTGLVLATGATPRRLPLPGGDAPNVLALRYRDDASAIAGAHGPLQRTGPARGRDRRRFHRSGSGRHRAQEGPGGHGAGSRAAPAGPRAGAGAVATGTPSCTAATACSVVLGAQIAAIETDAHGQANGVRMQPMASVCPAGLVVVGVGVAPTTTWRRLPAWNATAASWSTPAAAPPTRASSPPVTAPHAAWPTAACCGWSRCRTPPSKASPPPPRCWGRSGPSPPRPGSGPTSTTRSCRWPACRTGADAWAVRGEPAARGPFSVYHFTGRATDRRGFSVNAHQGPPAGAQAAGRRGITPTWAGDGPNL